jgi:Beta-propeller repeat
MKIVASFSSPLQGLPRHPLLAMAGVCAIAVCAQAQSARPGNFQNAPAFEEVHGDPSERYLWRNSGTAISLGPAGRLSVLGGDESGRSAAHLGFAGASVRSEARGEVRTAGKTIYYRGPGTAGRAAAEFERVRYPGIYPGIDLVFVTAGGRLEYNFEIAPHADPRAIRIGDERASFELTPEGDLEVHAGNTVVTERRPQAFQTVGGRTRPIACAYRLIGHHQADLRLGAYDPGMPLIIDPVVNFSTYFGGPSYDSINAAAMDAQGNLYVAGETSSGSLTNPSAGARASRDAFVAKFNSAGTQVSAVYMGGSDYDSARGIALDPAGNIYVTGVTDSSDFPVTGGALATVAPGSGDAFVFKLSPSFDVQYSTYLGGGSPDSGSAIAVDSTGAAYVTGQTASTSFPVTQGAFQTSNQGGVSDCFISKLNPGGASLAYSTYLGGNALDLCAGIALDASGNAYVAGSTNSDIFPVLAPLQMNLLGTTNAFVAKLNAPGSALLYSTYLGGSNIDNAMAIAVDSTGAAYVAGDTASIDFPTTLGVVQNALKGQYNAFVAKLSATGNGLVYSTLIGGSDTDVATSIALDAAGRTVIGGYTSSFDFPTFNPIQTFQGVFDAFGVVLDPNGVSLVFSSYFGGSGDDRGSAVVAAPLNELVLAGSTSSANFPVVSGVQAALSVAPDGFLMEVAYIAIAGIPAANSVTPSSGSGTSQTFALQYSDTAGAGNLQQVAAYFNATLATPPANACQFYYNVSTNQLNLLNDAGTAGQAATLGTAATLQNSQCSLNVGAASVAPSGNTLTLNIPITFLVSFAGPKNIYMSASDVSEASSGWQQRGAWTVPGAVTVAQAILVTPSSGSGVSQTFTMQYSDSLGAASLQQVWVYFNATLASPAVNSCQVYYNLPLNQIDLLNDAGTLSTEATPGTATTLQNSQCSVNVAAATLALSGNALTLSLPLTFRPGFAGAKNIYLYASDQSGSNSGWQQRGTWTVPGAVGPAALGVTPSSGSGTSQVFALQYSDSLGAASLQQVWVYFNATLANPAVNACLLYYNTATNQINLLGDNGTAWQAATVGTANTLENSQCSINAAATTVALSGNTVTWNVAMTFTAAYDGAKNVYMMALQNSGTSSGWQQLGTWTVGIAAPLPAAVSVTPSSGSGATQSFTLQYSDTTGAGNLNQVWVYFNATLANPASNTCLLYYSPATNQINLLGDNGTTWQAATVGTAVTLQNSQCSVNAATTSVARSGNSLAWIVPMTFKPSYVGAKNTFLLATDGSGTSSGWQQLGAWTVPGIAGTPTTVSATPGSGSGSGESLALQYSDTQGAASLQQLWVYFNSTLANPASNACLLYYSTATNQISLLGDDGMAWQAVTLGSATTLQNSQCSINVGTTTVVAAGNTVTWTVAMTFTPAFDGAKNTYLLAVDVSGVSSGWKELASLSLGTAGGAPTVVSVTPSSGSGARETFALQYSDTAGAASLQQVWVYFNAALNNPASHTCLVYYSTATNEINLLGDNGTAWQAETLGGATTLQNSQCSVDVSATTVAQSGDTVTLSLAMTFQPSYAGSKNTFILSVDVSGSNSGWQQLGVWTVP